MSKFRLAGAMALWILTAYLPARAAAPELPPDAVAPDTLAVIHMDMTRFTPAALRQAANTVLGPNAAMFNASLASFQEKYDKGQAAGLQSMTLIVGSPKKAVAGAGAAAVPGSPAVGAPGAAPAAPQAVVYLRLQPGADPKALQALIEKDMAPPQRAKAQFKQSGNYLIMHDEGVALPTQSDSTRGKNFASALGTLGTSAIQIAFIPDPQMKQQMLKQANAGGAPQGMKDAAPLLANSKWMTLGVNFGNAPSLTLSANTADADSAKQLVDAINGGLAEMKQAAAHPGQGGGGGAGMIAPMLAPLAAGLTPTQDGTQVSVSIKGQTLSMIGTMASMYFQLANPAGGARPQGRGGFGPGGPPVRPAPGE
ncbi:MAG TPA: hypothetical protein VFC78_13415 [Tepidisphaeraceae bacterium]|nr:hypothetical protein [Tepidisphaeraceae bacterium]